MPSKPKFNAKSNARALTDSTKTQIPKALFSTGLDTIATKWYKNPRAANELLPSIRQQELTENLRIAEALVISPKVSFRIRGENVVLCALVDTFGAKHVERLLEEGALEFILWRGEVLKWEKPRPGLHPLAPFVANDPAHSDPQASVELGLKGWSRRPWPEVERLAKLAAERTVLLNESLPTGDKSRICSL
jgi:hypothetical protein